MLFFFLFSYFLEWYEFNFNGLSGPRLPACLLTLVNEDYYMGLSVPLSVEAICTV